MVLGLHVAVKCKSNIGEYETKATGGLDRNGIYNFELPSDLIGEKGELKNECFAQLHNSETNAPCPQNNKEPAEASKLIMQFKKNGAHFLSPSSKLPYTAGTCTSKFYWLHHKKHFFGPIYKKHYYGHIYKKPLLPPVKPCPPTYEKPIYKKKLPYFPPMYKKAFHHFPKYPPSHA